MAAAKDYGVSMLKLARPHNFFAPNVDEVRVVLMLMALAQVAQQKSFQPPLILRGQCAAAAARCSGARRVG